MQLPTELLVSQEKANRGIVYTSELQQALPSLASDFAVINQKQRQDGDFMSYTDRYYSHIFDVKHHLGTVSCLVLHDGTPGNQADVLWLPFADSEPSSLQETINHYAHNDEPSLSDKIKGKPNSHGAALKVSTHYDLASLVEGYSGTTLAFFAPRPMTVYDVHGRRQVWGGDFTPDTDLLEKALEKAEEIISAGGDTSYRSTLSRLDIAGASKGGHQAVATGSELMRRGEREVLSVTTQEMVMGTDSLFDLAKGYLFAQNVGEPSDIEPNDPIIHDLDFRRQSDAHGNEPAMFWRMAKGMSKVGDLVGMSKRKRVLPQIASLIENGVKVTSFYGVNSGVAHRTGDIFAKEFGDDVAVVPVRALAGQYAGHLINENHNELATAFVLGRFHD
jgi:hypothetical protein